MSREEQVGSIDLEKPSPQHSSPIDDVATDDFDDPNLDFTAFVTDDDSPYAEVRSAVANTDDPTMPASTFRVWVIGLIWAIIMSGVNQFFYFRYPSVYVGPIVSLLLSFPIGKLWARYLPNVSLFGVSLNPGPFTIKEHVLVTIMADATSGTAYATDVIAVQRLLYNQHPNFIYQWLVVMSTQLIGFSIGGLCKRFLVTPSPMIWPKNLATAALVNTLHSQETSGSRSRDGISRQRFFTYGTIGYIFYNFLPSYLFIALSSFSWVCWIAPRNVKINQLFGTDHGMGMGILTFNWGQIAYNGSPLSTPWWTAANTGFTIVIFYWLITVILYYNSVWYSSYLPLVDSLPFDNGMAHYNVSNIINADSSFNVEAYKAYSPLFLPASFAMTYGLGFASITATITHTLLYYRQRIWYQARGSLFEQPDIHARLMSVYKEVPDWWYLTIFMTMFVFGVVAIEVWDTQLPVWAFMLALVISFIFTVPVGVIQAMTNQLVALNVITELIIGYILPGRPIAMMLFKTWGNITMVQAIHFTSNFKLGHYMKIPYRPMFLYQIVAIVAAGTVQLAVQAWIFSNVQWPCWEYQIDGFSCPHTNVFGTASIIWGVIGPQRLFSSGQLYHGLMLFFVVGIIAPLFQWVMHKKFKMKFFKYVNFPVIFASTSFLPPAKPINYVTSVIVCFVFNSRVRRRHFSWWSKYNYVLSAALDAGYAVGMIIVFFALQYPKTGPLANLLFGPEWWGNRVHRTTLDWVGIQYTVPPGWLNNFNLTFGPSSW